MEEITRMLGDIGEEKATAGDLLLLVYGELRALAASRMASEAAGHTLQPTALVHEIWMRLAGKDSAAPAFANRAHFFAAAAEAMRRILIDRARGKSSVKRGGGWKRVDFAPWIWPPRQRTTSCCWWMRRFRTWNGRTRKRRVS